MEQETELPSATKAFRGVLFQVRLMAIMAPDDTNAQQIMRYIASQWDTHEDYQEMWKTDPLVWWSILAMVESE